MLKTARNRLRGFTLIELVIVVIIIGILSTVAIVNYIGTIEKGRASEAKTTLAQIRTAWSNYYLEHQAAPGSFADLELNETAFPGPANCNEGHFFRYGITGTTAFAWRCTSKGKKPNADNLRSYNITMDLENGSWGGTPGHF